MDSVIEDEFQEWLPGEKRNLLTDVFAPKDNGESLAAFYDFCRQHYPEVYRRFASNMSQQQQFIMLLEHCERRLETPTLLRQIKAHAPETWHKHYQKRMHDPLSLYTRGNIYQRKYENDRAIACYSLAITLNPEFVDAFYERGNIYQRQGDLEQSIADYTQVVVLEPAHINALYCRGLAYDDRGETELAIADYTRVLELDPKFVDAYYCRGLACYYRGDIDRAIADYSRVVELQPDKTRAYHNRGLAYKRKGEHHHAIADFRKVLEVSTDRKVQQKALEQLQALGALTRAPETLVLEEQPEGKPDVPVTAYAEGSGKRAKQSPTTNPLQSQVDYERGLSELKRLAEQHGSYHEFAAYEQELRANLEEERLQGVSLKNSTERFKIVRRFNKLTKARLGVRLTDLCLGKHLDV